MHQFYRSATRYGFYAGCYVVLIGLVLLPWATGFEPREFWGL